MVMMMTSAVFMERLSFNNLEGGFDDLQGLDKLQYLVAYKRTVAMAKTQGDMLGAIEWLNKYLEIITADHDAWRELAEVYISLSM
ncbi:ER membrane protein complex subunit 2-like [Ipomoea triloba]|uniref:ER membrane protein complex subunit 2-like n=1 Tax=Ipomoea triloba TaxID=35885 RepID=UPI00125DA329|nr:ER membrane protein complex subunit 2-like [Ipomoea triloba]